jgi:hypothetical protein
MKYSVEMWTGFIWFRIPVAISCERGNETSGSIKGGEFIDYLSNYQFLKKDSTPWS